MTGRRRRVTEALLYLAPAAWRDRYRDEVLAQLASSEWRVRDVADIVLTALGLRADQIRRRKHMTKIALAIVVVGALWTAWAVPQLAGGLTELPGHWWSAPGPALLLTGGLLAALAAHRRHQANRSTDR